MTRQRVVRQKSTGRYFTRSYWVNDDGELLLEPSDEIVEPSTHPVAMMLESEWTTDTESLHPAMDCRRVVDGYRIRYEEPRGGRRLVAVALSGSLCWVVREEDDWTWRLE